jgi:ubiquinone/menaquinone biosynthesis C-methylase UbiE
MGLYAERIFPWITDKVMAAPDLEALRREALAPARGRVVEIGSGSGLNLALYPDTVDEVVAVEPSEGMRRRSRERVARSPVPVEVVGTVGERLPLDDASFDTAVCTFVLCSVDDPGQVMREIRRVLRPGGKLIVLEHGLAEDAGVARWQHRLDPVQQVVACGCHLTRDVRRMVEDAGLRFEHVRQQYLPHAPRPLGWVTLGLASAPA